MHLNLIPKYDILDNKCEICVQAKIPKKSFKSIDRDSNILELIHNDVCDLKRVSRGGNKYLVIFIDDYFKYCYVHIHKIKDEVFKKFKIFKFEAEKQ